jgi:hypothetical protein
MAAGNARRDGSYERAIMNKYRIVTAKVVDGAGIEPATPAV